MRIIVLSPRVCWPPNSGAKLREYHLVQGLARQAEVTLVAFSLPGVPAMNRENLPFCHQVLTVPRPALYSPANVVRGLLGPVPLPILNYTSRAMQDEVRRLAETRFDVVQMESIHMAGSAALFRHQPTLVVYDWHNIESELMQRYSERSAGPRGWYAARTAGQLARVERQALQEADGHIVCSEREQTQLRSWNERARIEVVDNGVDAHQFGRPSAKPRFRLLFVGQMSYHANIEAAIDFARRLWPGLRERLPELRLTIVGSQPPAEVLALGGLPGVEVTGTVPEVQPYYEEALAAIVPLKTGGGTRLKILEAMAASVPVVSTSIGAEGLAVTPGKELLIADTDDQWLPQLEQAIQPGALRQSLIAQGRQLVESRYDWTPLGQRLVSVYRDWLAAGRLA